MPWSPTKTKLCICHVTDYPIHRYPHYAPIPWRELIRTTASQGEEYQVNWNWANFIRWHQAERMAPSQSTQARKTHHLLPRQRRKYKLIYPRHWTETAVRLASNKLHQVRCGISSLSRVLTQLGKTRVRRTKERRPGCGRLRNLIRTNPKDHGYLRLWKELRRRRGYQCVQQPQIHR